MRIVPHDAGLAGKIRGNRSKLDRHLSFNVVTGGRLREAGARQARYDTCNIGEEFPDRLRPTRYRKGLLDHDIWLAAVKTKRAPSTRQFLLYARRGSEHGGSPVGCRLGTSRPDWAERAFLMGRFRVPASPSLIQCAADRAYDSNIAGAPAEIAAELGPDSRLIGIRKPHDNVARGHQHARCAVTALQSVLLRKSTPQSGHDDVVLKPFDRGDRGAIAHDSIGYARTGRLSVDQQRACAASALLAAQMSGSQV